MKTDSEYSMMRVLMSALMISKAVAGEPVQVVDEPLSATLFPRGANRVDFETDGLVSDDIEIYKSSLQFEQVAGSWKWSGAVGWMKQSVDYEPFTTTLPAHRDEETWEYGFELQKTLSPNWALLATGTLVDGYADHRSIWISEFYDQSNGLNPQYREADPGSIAVSVGGQWSYRPGLGSLQVTTGFSRADIVPGWGREFNPDSGRFELVSTDPELDTYSGSVVWQAAVNPRTMSKHTLRFSETEGRELRTQLQTEWAFSLTPELTLRAQLGAAEEKPEFDAIYGGLTLVYEISPRWQVDIGYRYYEDSGEINTSNFNTAAPGIQSQEFSVGVLWSQGGTSVRASAGYYDTDFDEITNPENDVFTNLYQDRDFLAARLAVTHRF